MKNKGITLISLVITIIILIILASVAIYLGLSNNGIFNRANEAKELTNKQTATEIINLKITTAQMNKYAEKQEMPTLKELSLILGNDNEIEYVTETSKVASTEYDVPSENPTSIYTKLSKYPYEFEINSSLQLASINGVKIANNNKSNWTFLGEVKGKGTETTNYIDLTKIDYTEIYIYTQTSGFSYSFNILKEILSSTVIYPQLGMDAQYRVGVAMTDEKAYMYCAFESGKDVSNDTTVYFYYK